MAVSTPQLNIPRTTSPVRSRPARRSLSWLLAALALAASVALALVTLDGDSDARPTAPSYVPTIAERGSITAIEHGSATVIDGPTETPARVPAVAEKGSIRSFDGRTPPLR